mgnify:CR=1 FL=1
MPHALHIECIINHLLLLLDILLDHLRARLLAIGLVLNVYASQHVFAHVLINSTEFNDLAGITALHSLL